MSEREPPAAGPHAPAIVLFACVHNAGRSQLAAAWFFALADPARAVAVSAGTQPAGQVHPDVLAVLGEVSLPSAPPRLLTDALARSASLLITMGCGESCPHVPGLEREDWPIQDPKARSLVEVRAISVDIRARVAALVARRGWARGA